MREKERLREKEEKQQQQQQQQLQQQQQPAIQQIPIKDAAEVQPVNATPIPTIKVCWSVIWISFTKI